MAGIGLTLRKLVADQTYLRGAAAYFSSGIITAGPWLIAVISLALLQGVASTFLTPDDRLMLFATITYAFVASSILTGPVQIVLTRIVADQIFTHEIDSIAPTFTLTLIQSATVLGLMIVPFFVWAPFDLPNRLLTGSLFLTVSLIWLVLAVVSAAQDYFSLMLAFVIGYAISGGAMLWLGRQYGLLGALEGFTLGQVVCLGLLSQRVYLEFPHSGPVETSPNQYWREYWSLALVGLFYYLGLWAEKLFYWFSAAGTAVQGFYRTFPLYDSAILLAYLLTIPASAVFLVNIETDFNQQYHAFYRQILRQTEPDGSQSMPGNFQQITEARLGMIKAARSGFYRLLKVQGTIALFACLIAPDLVSLLGLPGEAVTTLRIAIFAASGQMFVLYAMLLLLYLDARKTTLMVVAVFAASNLGLTALTALLAPRTYGLGYLLSTIIAALLGLRQLNTRLAKLDYVTFMLQPLQPARISPDLPARTSSPGGITQRLPR